MMKKRLAVLLLGALLCFAGCTDDKKNHGIPRDSVTGTDGTAESDTGRETDRETDSAETRDDYTKRY